MEQASMIVTGGRHSGWSEEENKLLWETADEAQVRGIPLKQVFERIAEQTGRRPNSIRNYYYAQVRQREGGVSPSPRFVPFQEEEVSQLVEQVLRARAKGQSVRSCLQEMSGGNHSLMLRYQNKYRSVLKNRPDLIGQLVGKLKEEGVDCEPPEVRPRLHATVEQACGMLESTARSVSDAEIIRACEVLAQMILSCRGPEENGNIRADRMQVRLDLYRMALTEKTELIRSLCQAADELTMGIKEYLIRDEDSQHALLSAFCRELSEKIGALEGRISAAQQPGSDC